MSEPNPNPNPVNDVRARPEPPVAGPHFRNLALAAGLLVAIVGVSLFFAPFGEKKNREPRNAPAPPQSTFLDQPPAEPHAERDGEASRPWWQRFAPPQDGRATLDPGYAAPNGEPAYPAYPADPPYDQSAYGPIEPAPSPPVDPRVEEEQRARKSFSLRKAGEPRRVAPASAAAGASPISASAPAPSSAASTGAITFPDGFRLPSPESLAASLAPPPAPAPLPPPDPRVYKPAETLARTPLASIRTLRAGTLIPARLETALDSDAPGPVIARVVRDVTDSSTGRTILIPAGAQILGTVVSGLEQADRALVVFERLVWRGVSYELPRLESLAGGGELGLTGRVDHHFLSSLGRATMLALVGAGFEISQPRRSIDSTLSTGDIAASRLALELDRIASQILSRNLERPPTVRVPAGERFHVFLNRDLTL